MAGIVGVLSFYRQEVALAMIPEETLGWLLELGKTCRVLEAQIEFEPSTWVSKVQETPELWPEQSARAGTPMVVHDQVGKSASLRHPAREKASSMIGLGLPGRRCPTRATSGYQHTPRSAD